jgi:trk system potassium uptake protein
VRDGFLLVVLVWTVLPAFAALPFMLQLGMSHTDAYFEAVSGLTATGATDEWAWTACRCRSTCGGTR